MNYAVKTFKYMSPKVIDAPDNYPAEIRPLGTGTILPAGAGWQLMDDAQLAAALADPNGTFSKWTATNSTTPQEQNHEVDTYNSKGCLLTQTWYATKVSSGVYADIARQITYTYDSTGSSVLSSVENLYNTDGVIYWTEARNFLSDRTSPTKTVILEKQ